MVINECKKYKTAALPSQTRNIRVLLSHLVKRTLEGIAWIIEQGFSKLFPNAVEFLETLDIALRGSPILRD